MLTKNRRSTKRKSLRSREKKGVEKRGNRPRGAIENNCLRRKKRRSNLVVKRLNELRYQKRLEIRVAKAGLQKLLPGAEKQPKSRRLFNQGSRKQKRSHHVGSSIETSAEKSRIRKANPALTIQRATRDPSTTRPT